MDSVGSRRLTRHLARKKLTLEAFAKSVGTSKALVSYWRRGLKVPGTGYAVEIEKQTGIPPSAWLPVRRDRRRSPHHSPKTS